MKGNLHIYYDQEGDFLEVFFGEPTPCLAEEIEPDVFIRRDEKTNEVKSIGIIGFKKRTSILRELLEKLNLNFPIDFRINV